MREVYECGERGGKGEREGRKSIYIGLFGVGEKGGKRMNADISIIGLYYYYY